MALRHMHLRASELPLKFISHTRHLRALAWVVLCTRIPFAVNIYLLRSGARSPCARCCCISRNQC